MAIITDVFVYINVSGIISAEILVWGRTEERQ